MLSLSVLLFFLFLFCCFVWLMCSYVAVNGAQEMSVHHAQHHSRRNACQDQNEYHNRRLSLCKMHHSIVILEGSLSVWHSVEGKSEKDVHHNKHNPITQCCIGYSAKRRQGRGGQVILGAMHASMHVACKKQHSQTGHCWSASGCCTHFRISTSLRGGFEHTEHHPFSTE